MRRALLGTFLVLHGLGHAAIGMAAQDAPHGLAAGLGPRGAVALAAVLFAVAMPGFVAAGFGVWGVVALVRWVVALVRVAAMASVLLLSLFARRPLESAVGLALDVLAIAFVLVVIRPLGARPAAAMTP